VGGTKREVSRERIMSIAVILIATGKRYEEHIAPCIASLREFFPPCDIILFTDDKTTTFGAKKFDYPDLGWPDATMMRYHAIYEKRGHLLCYDQIFYMDVDMRIVSKIELNEIYANGITAVIHPYFPDTFERRQESSAYIAEDATATYYQGCFVGGATGAFLQMCRVISQNIDTDKEKGLTAVWFDESHLNRYLHDNPPGKVLSRAYAWPEGWTAIKDPKIVHVEKNDQSWKDSNKIVRGVWTGPRLTNIQKLCIRSYINQGHEFHLYVTEPTDGIPEGTVVHSCDEICSPSERSNFDNCVHFCDYFRVLLILKEGGWFVDLDTVCFRRLDFNQPYVFVSEEQLRTPASTPALPTSSDVQEYISGCVFKAPKGSEILKYIISRIEGMDKMHPDNWLSFGPALFKEAVSKFRLSKYVMAPIVLDAMRYDEMSLFVTPGVEWAFTDKSYLIHLRTSAWTTDALDSDRFYPKGCLFEKLKRDNFVYGPKVSIVIPVYNMKELLKETIESALAQTYRNCEVVVVDDGSMDNVHTVSQQFTGLIVWMRQVNHGLNTARNTGSKAATGSLLLFLDADDLLDARYLEKTVPLMTEGVGIVATDMQYFGESSLVIPVGGILEQQKGYNQMPYCALMRREAFEQAGRYTTDPDIWAYGDWDLSLAILKRGWKCVALHEPLFRYRMRANSMRGVAAQTHEQMCLAIRKNHPDLFPETK
jgi:hypothetical protein